MEEYRSLIWDEKSVKRQEHPACENHAADAALYGWRHCYNYLSQRPPAQSKPGTPEWFEEEEEEMLEREVERFQREAMELQELEECGMGPMFFPFRR